jgi:hypothetical protein
VPRNGISLITPWSIRSSIFHFCPSLLPIQKSSIYQHSIIDRVRSRPPISRVLRLSWLLSFHAFLSMHHSSLPLLFVPSILLILFHPRLIIQSGLSRTNQLLTISNYNGSLSDKVLRFSFSKREKMRKTGSSGRQDSKQEVRSVSHFWFPSPSRSVESMALATAVFFLFHFERMVFGFQQSLITLRPSS